MEQTLWPYSVISQEIYWKIKTPHWQWWSLNSVFWNRLKSKTTEPRSLHKVSRFWVIPFNFFKNNNYNTQNTIFNKITLILCICWYKLHVKARWYPIVTARDTTRCRCVKSVITEFFKHCKICLYIPI